MRHISFIFRDRSGEEIVSWWCEPRVAEFAAKDGLTVDEWCKRATEMSNGTITEFRRGDSVASLEEVPE